MRYIPIESVKPNMMLGNDVFDSYGRLLISKGSILTTEYIERLKELNVFDLYIDDKLSKGIEVRPPISPQLKAEGIQAVKSRNIDKCRIISKRIVEDMLEHGAVSMDMVDLKTFDDYTFSHSVNVAVLSCTIGIGLNLNSDSLEDLVLAGLLHDLGKLDIPQEILNKEERLSREEFALIKTHPHASYEMIRDRVDISSLVKHAVLSHHENFDGSGYPNGLSGNNIGVLARILHVADVYDALTSKRTYKEPYSPYAAVQILEGGSGSLYDPEAVRVFLTYVPLYPKGTMITLSDGKRAIVVENSGVHNKRPIIRTDDFEELDLSLPQYSDLIISTPSEADFLSIEVEEAKRMEMIAPLKRRTLLVYDKSGKIFDEVARKLTYLYDFKQVKSDSQAECYLKVNGLPDLILVDADGMDFSEKERITAMGKRISNAVPVIVMGSFRDINTVRFLKEAGVSNYILKPFKIIYLQTEIRRTLSSYKLR